MSATLHSSTLRCPFLLSCPVWFCKLQFHSVHLAFALTWVPSFSYPYCRPGSGLCSQRAADKPNNEELKALVLESHRPESASGLWPSSPPRAVVSS